MVRRFRLFVARVLARLVFRGPVKLGRAWFDPATGRVFPAQAGAEGDGDGGDDAATADADQAAGDDADQKDAGDADADDDSDDADGDVAAGKKEPDWKREARKHERRAKKTQAELAEAQRKLKEREDAQKSEQEKAIEKAKAEAKAEAEGGFEETRRADKIENAVTKLASGGFKVTVKDGDEEKEKTVRFADSDDAQLRIDRALRDGDLEYEDIYADGKVKTDAVTEFLRDLLEEHPRLQATDGTTPKPKKPEGGADAGRGKGSGKSLEELTPEEHYQRIRRNKDK
jgi:hypothetical protein